MDAWAILAWCMGRQLVSFANFGVLIRLGKSGLCAFISVTWMGFMSIVFFFPTTKHTNTQEMNYTVVVLGGVLILSLVWFYLPVYGGVHWFKGPVPTVEEHIPRKWVTEQEKDVEEGSTGSIHRTKVGDVFF